MDPISTQNACIWITIIKDIVVAISTASMAILAYRGITTWRKELKGKAEYQLAKNVLKAVYKVRDAFKIVRHPFIYSYEYPEKMTDHSGHLKSEYNYEGTLNVYEKRFEKLDEAFRDLEEKHFDAQVEWGAQFQEIIVPLGGAKRIC